MGLELVFSITIFASQTMMVLDLAKKRRETSPWWLYTVENESYMEKLGQNKETYKSPKPH